MKKYILLLWMFISTVSFAERRIKITPKLRKSILDTLKIDGREIAIITLENEEKIYIKFFPEDAPKTVKNFIMLSNLGFYDGLTFHRVVKEPKPFVVQGGDPLGNGTGNAGYNIEAEFNERPHLLGTVAMARSSDPNSASCQFYICLAPQPHLDKQYTVFGQVIKGMEAVKRIKKGDKMRNIRIEKMDFQELELVCKGTHENVIYSPPVPKSITLPAYPKEALNERIEGDISLRISITEKGEVKEVKILSPRTMGIDKETLKKIVKTWVFIPPKIGGTPVSDWINADIEFRIKRRTEWTISCLGVVKSHKK